MKKKFFVLAILFALLLTSWVYASGGYAPIINKARPGMPFDITKEVVKGKITIFDFYSEYCGPCVRIAPKLVELDKMRDDIVVKKLDINRRGIRGIDWRSPLVAMYKIRSVPSFYIFNKKGKIEIAGPNAYRKVLLYIRESGIK